MLSLIQVADVLDVALELLDFPVPIDAQAMAAEVLSILSKTADSCAVCAAVGDTENTAKEAKNGY